MKVFVVIGIWEGKIEEVHSYTDSVDADTKKAQIQKMFDTRADRLADEPPENMNYSVDIKTTYLE